MKDIQVGKLTISPNLERTIKDIHPAIGVVGDTAYVGVWLPCRIVDDKDNVKYKDLLFLVTDKRELMLANDEVFRGKNLDWQLEYKPIKFPNRWPLKDVQAYLDGGTVDPAIAFQEMVDVWQKFMELPNEKEYLYHALWDVGSYFHHLFNCYPYPYLGGVKRSGKTKGLTLHYCLAFNAIFSNNMSTAAIYRLIQNARTTLLIDESEKLAYRGKMSERTLEFRSILLSGYKRGAKAYRIEKTRKEVLQPRPFETYSPKALANIQGLEDVIEDRCKPTILKRSRNPKIINLEVDERSGEHWSELRSELYLLFLVYWREIKEIYDGINDLSELGEFNEVVNLENTLDLDVLVGRELELWKGIIALATFFDRKRVSLSKFTSSPSSLTTLILELAVQDAKQRQTENTTETGSVILAQVLLNIVKAKEHKDDFLPVKTLKEKMSKAYDEEQKWLTTRWIGNALRRLGFTEKRRVGTGYQYKICKVEVEDLANRLSIEVTPTPLSVDELKLKDGPHQLVGEECHSGLCYRCNQTTQIEWYFNDVKGEKHELCTDCGWLVSNELKERLGG